MIYHPVVGMNETDFIAYLNASFILESKSPWGYYSWQLHQYEDAGAIWGLMLQLKKGTWKIRQVYGYNMGLVLYATNDLVKIQRWVGYFQPNSVMATSK